jgi:hypothetical protein
MSDLSICQSQEWRDDWCARAIAVGSGGYTDLESQEVDIRLISFDEPATAEALFSGEGTADEVGQKPPGVEIDGYEPRRRQRAGQAEGSTCGSGLSSRRSSTPGPRAVRYPTG